MLKGTVKTQKSGTMMEMIHTMDYDFKDRGETLGIVEIISRKTRQD